MKGEGRGKMGRDRKRRKRGRPDGVRGIERKRKWRVAGREEERGGEDGGGRRKSRDMTRMKSKNRRARK